jgi:ribosomal protein L9
LEKLSEKGFIFDKKHVSSFSPIKELGVTNVTISLHKDVETEVQVEVVSENPIEDSE